MGRWRDGVEVEGLALVWLMETSSVEFHTFCSAPNPLCARKVSRVVTLFPLSFPSVRGGDRHVYMWVSIRAEDLFCPRPEIQLERRKESFILMERLGNIG